MGEGHEMRSPIVGLHQSQLLGPLNRVHSTPGKAGNRSHPDSDPYAILTSIIHTCRQQDQDLSLSNSSVIQHRQL
jgi:hypothetical protein